MSFLTLSSANSLPREEIRQVCKSKLLLQRVSSYRSQNPLLISASNNSEFRDNLAVGNETGNVLHVMMYHRYLPYTKRYEEIYKGKTNKISKKRLRGNKVKIGVKILHPLKMF